MFIVVNGKACPLPNPQTLDALVCLLSPAAPFAVALNEEVILRGAYEDCRIFPGDRIDIVHPTAGG